MKVFNDFINNLIPDRFKLTYELKTKARGLIISQLIIGSILVTVGLSFWFQKNELSELVLNTGIGVFIITSILALKFFQNFESYVGLILTGGYVVVFTFVIISGGIFADAPFWLLLLISISVLYTTTKQSVIWITIVFLFLSGLFYYELNGLDLGYFQPSYTKKATTLFSYFVLSVTVAYSYSRINIRKNIHHLEIIANHKRLLKERDDLMSIIAHDMKSPVNRIEGLLSIFETDNLSKDQKEIIERLNKTALESTHLIDDLLEAKSFQSKITVKKIRINDIINDLKTSFLPLANKKGIRLILRGLRSNILVETSEVQLRRILDNLLSNAIKFTELDSRVEVICVQNKLNTTISIQDQGPGFNHQDELKMFQMFQKLSARPTAGESSTGLGLSIVKTLTELLNGEIKYVTQQKKGTTFTLVLPNKFSSTEEGTASKIEV